MEFPVRCFSCGAVIGHLYEEYKKGIETGSAEQVLNSMGIERYCCRRMFVSHVEGMDLIKKYKKL
ncbi:MAG: DNA-directed RNA polymerase subunit N [Candidatus ainarchaeum sp.]|nr:DNA-directed RNA polymerase subunit N [Candidatus ainarchaeum sp.]MDD5095932.1 DNA-directed RNA polymerase subunit N [Candidatus ainarchaeum sp.]